VQNGVGYLQPAQSGLKYAALVPIDVYFELCEDPIPFCIVVAFPAHSALATLIGGEFASMQPDRSLLLDLGIFGHNWYLTFLWLRKLTDIPFRFQSLFG
jgi:hypothetical protein